MSLSERDRAIITDTLDTIEDIAAKVILAGLESFTEWLASELPGVFRKIRDQIRDIWHWLRNRF
jgi:hypothetical protein